MLEKLVVMRVVKLYDVYFFFFLLYKKGSFFLKILFLRGKKDIIIYSNKFNG